MIQQILLSVIFVSAAVYLYFYHRDKHPLRYIFKPLTTLLIIGLALLQDQEVSQTYRYLIVAGLVFSLTGDIFLELPTDRFIAGLV